MFMRKIMIMLLCIIFLAGFLFGCSSGSGPEGVAEAFIDNSIKKDVKACTKLSAVKDDSEVVMLMGIVHLGLSMTKDRKFTYKVRQSSEKKALVDVKGEKGHFCSVELVKADGNWKVSFVK